MSNRSGMTGELANKQKAVPQWDSLYFSFCGLSFSCKPLFKEGVCRGARFCLEALPYSLLTFIASPGNIYNFTTGFSPTKLIHSYFYFNRNSYTKKHLPMNFFVMVYRIQSIAFTHRCSLF